MKIYATATLDYGRPVGSTFTNEPYWRVTWNSGPAPEQFGTPFAFPVPHDGSFPAEEANATLAEFGVTVDRKGWNWLDNIRSYRATGTLSPKKGAS